MILSKSGASSTAAAWLPFGAPIAIATILSERLNSSSDWKLTWSECAPDGLRALRLKFDPRSSVRYLYSMHLGSNRNQSGK